MVKCLIQMDTINHLIEQIQQDRPMTIGEMSLKILDWNNRLLILFLLLIKRKLFVGGLTNETTKEHLIEYFSQYGKIEDASIKVDFNTGRSRGFGFILFESKEPVETILSIKDHVINGKNIDPKPAKHKGATPVRKVFVGGLDPSYPEADLRKYFSKYGKVSHYS